MQIELDPDKKDTAIILMLAQIIARQEVIMDILASSQASDIADVNMLKEKMMEDVTITTRQVLDYIYQEFGITPNVEGNKDAQ